jgi:hypothetical protein
MVGLFITSGVVAYLFMGLIHLFLCRVAWSKSFTSLLVFLYFWLWPLIIIFTLPRYVTLAWVHRDIENTDWDW